MRPKGCHSFLRPSARGRDDVILQLQTWSPVLDELPAFRFRGNADFLETALFERRLQIPYEGRARETTGVQRKIMFDFIGQWNRRDHIGNREAAAVLQHPEGFAKYLRLIQRKIDDAVTDDHIDRRIRYREMLDLA